MLLSVVHIITIIIALTDEAYVGWMKRGGTVVVAIASIVDVVVQVCGCGVPQSPTLCVAFTDTRSHAP